MGCKVITVAGLKGGTAKTSVAANLAAYWPGKGRKILLVDADPNGSATRLYERGARALLRSPSKCVRINETTMAVAKSWDLMLVDTAGGSRDEQQQYAEGSDFVLCPCQPAASSIELVIDLAELIKGTGTAFGVLLTMCDGRRAENTWQSRKVLQRRPVELPVLTSEISLLSCWPKAEAAGVAVRDARTDAHQRDPQASKAWLEVADLAAEITEKLS